MQPTLVKNNFGMALLLAVDVGPLISGVLSFLVS